MNQIVLVFFAACFVIMAVTLFLIYRNLNKLLLLMKDKKFEYWSGLGSPHYHLSNLGGGKTTETMAALRFGLAAMFGSHIQDISDDVIILEKYNKFRKLILLYNAFGFPVLVAWLIFIETVLPGKSSH